MNTIDLKAELKQLIESENDLGILQSLKLLLKKTRLNQELKSVLSSRAIQSENDIQSGKIYSKAEIEKKLNSK